MTAMIAAQIGVQLEALALLIQTDAGPSP